MYHSLRTTEKYNVLLSFIMGKANQAPTASTFLCQKKANICACLVSWLIMSSPVCDVDVNWAGKGITALYQKRRKRFYFTVSTELKASVDRQYIPYLRPISVCLLCYVFLAGPGQILSSFEKKLTLAVRFVWKWLLHTFSSC